jgi:hypothetical protein
MKVAVLLEKLQRVAVLVFELHERLLTSIAISLSRVRM